MVPIQPVTSLLSPILLFTSTPVTPKMRKDIELSRFRAEILRGIEDYVDEVRDWAIGNPMQS